MYRVKIITLFPNSFPGLLNTGVVGKALEKKIWSLQTIDPRKYSKRQHKQQHRRSGNTCCLYNQQHCGCG